MACLHAANETTQRALVPGVRSVLKPVGVCRENAERPDGMTLIPWECSPVRFHMP